MLAVTIPGRGSLELEYLVLDYNGTLACDGCLLPGVQDRLNALARQLAIYIITADTFGQCRAHCEGIQASLEILKEENGSRQKNEFIAKLGAEQTVAIGNGKNDCLMLQNAGLGIAVLGGEGAAAAALLQADIIVKDVRDALDLLLNPKRIVATLRE